ncbi:hypothetical protein RQP46_009737 [Phenoliferia psychrophenolica]
MTAFTLLASELLAHILKLSTEGESAEEQQRARFAFGLIARAFYLATADANDFHVAGEKVAKALISKLEREKKWAAQEERKASSGRTTRATLSITRVSNIRRLSFVLDTKSSGKALASLLSATPNLSDLTLDIQHDDALTVPASLDALEVALDASALLRILIPLKALQVLELPILKYPNAQNVKNLLDRLVIPQLRHLRIFVHPHSSDLPNTLFAALAASSTVESLDFANMPFSLTSTSFIKSFISYLPNLTRVTWTPDPEPLKQGTRAAAAVEDGEYDDDLFFVIATDEERIEREYNQLLNSTLDPTLFDTLATLQSLHTVHIVVNIGILSDLDLVSYLEETSESLRCLSLLVLSPGRFWTQEQRRRVEEAGEKAGVTFMYEERS